MITHQHLRIPGRIDAGAAGSSSGSALTPWTRPADWLALPAVNSGDKKFVGLHAVFNHTANFVAFTVAGNYTVDWGDGTPTENIASGVQANHNFVWGNLSSSTLTSDGFRQAIVTITMQGAANLTSLNLLVIHNQSGLTAGYNTGWLDIRMASSLLSTLTIGGTTPVKQVSLQQFEYVGSSSLTTASSLFSTCRKLGSVVGTAWTSGVTNFSSMFFSCSALQTIPLLNTASGTNFSGMFNACFALQTIPLLNTAAGTSFNTMFNSCASLQTIPLLNTAAGTSFNSMFFGCSALQTIPLLNTASGTNFGSMFNNCSALQTIPLLNTASGTNFGSMFGNCNSLQTIPLLNTAAGTDFSGMFSSCTALRTIPLLNTAAGTSFNTMFNNCSSLQTIPLLNTAAGITFTGMFSGCGTLQTIPLLNTAAGTNFSSMFFNCSALQTIPLLNTAAGTTFSGMFSGCSALQSIPLLNTAAGVTFTNMFTTCTSLSVGATAGARFAISYASCRLPAAGLDSIYTNLGAPSGGAQTITVSSNFGTTGDNPALVPSGWTVVGS